VPGQQGAGFLFLNLDLIQIHLDLAQLLFQLPSVVALLVTTCLASTT